MAKKLTPKELAKAFTQLFLENGSFASTGGAMSSSVNVAASMRPIFQEIVGFSGLSVQSVGYSVVEDVARESASDPDDFDVHIYVSRGSKAALKALPTEVGDLTCRVHNIGKLNVKPKQASITTHSGNLYLHDNKVACGSSCAPSGKSYSGTLGAILKDANGTLFALSNNHVFGDCNHTPIGQPILSPSSADGRPNTKAPGEICRHSNISELRSGAPTLVNPCKDDLAIAKLTNPDIVSSWQGDDKNGYDTPSSIVSPKSKMRVKKFGRTTGLTLGTMESEQYRFHIPYESDHFRSLVWFDGVWSIRPDSEPFALGGDSGSLVVTEDGSATVGVIFAAATNGSRAFLIPAARISAVFGNFELVHGHNVKKE